MSDYRTVVQEANNQENVLYDGVSPIRTGGFHLMGLE
jgi:hypothetical protein